MKNLLIIAVLLQSSVALAGSADAQLKCASASGRKSFEAAVQDLMSFTSAVFTIDKHKLKYSGVRNGHVVFYSAHKVFTLVIEDAKVGHLTFFAVPNTFKSTAKSPHDQEYEFKAVIQGTDPRGDMTESKTIYLTCALTYYI